VESTFFTDLMLFAADGAQGAPQAPGPSLFITLLPWLAIGFLFYYLLIRPQRQEQTRRQAMLAAVKKNDRIITTGGIYGVVANVHTEADKVTIKVDETTNTKLDISLGAIARVLGDETPNGKSSQK